MSMKRRRGVVLHVTDAEGADPDVTLDMGAFTSALIHFELDVAWTGCATADGTFILHPDGGVYIGPGVARWSRCPRFIKVSYSGGVPYEVLVEGVREIS